MAAWHASAAGAGEALAGIFGSRIVWAAASAWLGASAIKMLLFFRIHRWLNFRLLVGTGGMPSSHSAFVSALATAIGVEAGWDSPVFILALGFAVLTMNDAQGVRRATGSQASILNRIVDDLYHHKPVKPERVAELLGHTPIQVFIGAAVGVGIALLYYL